MGTRRHCRLVVSMMIDSRLAEGRHRQAPALLLGPVVVVGHTGYLVRCVGNAGWYSRLSTV